MLVLSTGEALEAAGQYMDHLYIQFYNNYCFPDMSNLGNFESTFNQWLALGKRTGMEIFIGLPAEERGASGAKYYKSTQEVQTLWNVSIKCKR